MRIGTTNNQTSLFMTGMAAAGLLLTLVTHADPEQGRTSADQRAVAALDTEYQRAVMNNDVATMSKILADDFVVIEGNGKVWTKEDLIESARNGKTHYERQQDTEQSVRVWGDTAVVTAKLWARGLEDGKHVDYTEWFSDMYVRTPAGWKYAFGQASLPLPKDARH